MSIFTEIPLTPTVEYGNAVSLLFGVPSFRTPITNLAAGSTYKIKVRKDDFVFVYVRSADGKLFQQFVVARMPDGSFHAIMEQQRNERG